MATAAAELTLEAVAVGEGGGQALELFGHRFKMSLARAWRERGLRVDS